MLKKEKEERSAPAPQSPLAAALPSRVAPLAARLTLDHRLSKRWAKLTARTRAVLTFGITCVFVVSWGLTALYMWRHYGQDGEVTPTSLPPSGAK